MRILIQWIGMTTPARTSRTLLRQPLQSPIGRVSLAGIVKGGYGMAPGSMRILGSYALAYILAGEGTYSDANGVEMVVGPGQMIVVFPDLPHRYGPPPGKTWDEIFIVFDGPVFDLWRQRGLIAPARPVLALQPVEYWYSRIRSTVAASVPDDGDAALQRICLVQQLLADAIAHEAQRQFASEDRQWLTRAQSLLEAQLDEPEQDQTDNLENVAAQLGMSYANFRKRFAKLARIPPARYRFSQLIQRSAEMMRDPSLTLRDIAAKCGFCNEFHFSRRFRQTVGLSPSEYRRRLHSHAAGS